MGRHRGLRAVAAAGAILHEAGLGGFHGLAGGHPVRLAEALRDGVPADGERAMDLAEQHRGHITNWCYDCSYEIHRGLGEMYLANERFRATYEGIEPGLARFVRDAIVANAEWAEA